MVKITHEKPPDNAFEYEIWLAKQDAQDEAEKAHKRREKDYKVQGGGVSRADRLRQDHLNHHQALEHHLVEREEKEWKRGTLIRVIKNEAEETKGEHSVLVDSYAINKENSKEEKGTAQEGIESGNKTIMTHKFNRYEGDVIMTEEDHKEKATAEKKRAQDLNDDMKNKIKAFKENKREAVTGHALEEGFYDDFDDQMGQCVTSNPQLLTPNPQLLCALAPCLTPHSPSCSVHALSPPTPRAPTSTDAGTEAGMSIAS